MRIARYECAHTNKNMNYKNILSQVVKIRSATYSGIVQ